MVLCLVVPPDNKDRGRFFHSLLYDISFTKGLTLLLYQYQYRYKEKVFYLLYSNSLVGRQNSDHFAIFYK